MKNIKENLLFLITVAFIALLILPISNLVIPRKTLEIKTENPKLRKFSLLLQQSCADCHTPNLTSYPFYFSLPIAKDIISQDIQSAHSVFVLDQDELTGKKPFNEAQLAKIRAVITDGSMPPLKYAFVHWRAHINKDDHQNLLDYINTVLTNNGFKPVPFLNKSFTDVKKVALGKELFTDKRLSADNSISCASCHAFNKGGTDWLPVATGIKGQQGPINAPTIFNATYNFVQFWDGRAANLKEQAAGPINNPVEMGSNWNLVLSKITKDLKYKKQFCDAYHGDITANNITDALASYEQTLITPDSRFDSFLRGDKTALNSEEQAGYKLFTSHNCATCHTGVNLGGLTFEKMGVEKDYFAWRGHLTQADNGRFNVTHNKEDLHKFKVPSLRNIALTHPYFHDGSTSDLHQAVKIMAEFQTNQPLSNQEATLIVKFLNSLTGKYETKSLADLLTK